MKRLMAVALLIPLHVAAAAAQSNPSGLSMAQQTKVGEIITKDAGAPVRGGTFTLSINSTVPAEVQLRPVPASVDAVSPQFRGQSYVVVDEQIAIVEPQTRKIV